MLPSLAALLLLSTSARSGIAIGSVGKLSPQAPVCRGIMIGSVGKLTPEADGLIMIGNVGKLTPETDGLIAIGNVGKLTPTGPVCRGIAIGNGGKLAPGGAGGWLPVRRARLVGDAGDPAVGPDAIALELDGALVLWTEAGAALRLEAAGATLVVPLEDPEATGPLGLELSLPAWLETRADAAGELELVPGDPWFDAALRGVEDGLVAR